MRGELLYTGGPDGFVRVWEIDSGACTGELDAANALATGDGVRRIVVTDSRLYCVMRFGSLRTFALSLKAGRGAGGAAVGGPSAVALDYM